MKKFYYIFAFLLCVLFAFSCGGDGNSDISTDTDELKNKRTTIREEYIAGEGGYILGESAQSVIYGSHTSNVMVKGAVSLV